MNNVWKDRSKVFIIAEAGVNHNGDVQLAKELIDAAIETKADAVKFQTWKPGELTGKFAFKVAYQQLTTAEAESRYELSRRLALPYEAFVQLQKYCQKKGILFLSTPDGYQSLDFLVDELNMPIIKIGSTEVTHLEFLKCVALKKRPIILSTGMSTLEEVGIAVNTMRAQKYDDITILHCTTEYPTAYDDVNLRAMISIRDAFGLPVGYSDHTLGQQASVAAVALGAKVIEKHLTLDKSMQGPDHKASMDVKEFKNYVQSIRIAEQILGDGVKRPTAAELKNLPGVRRGIVAKGVIKKGTTLTRELLTFKRPQTGVHPYDIEEILGKKVNKDLEEDEVLQWEHLS